MTLLPILYFHVSHLRIYILEAAAVYVLLILQRKFSQESIQATITRLKGTGLLSISIPLTKSGTQNVWRQASTSTCLSHLSRTNCASIPLQSPIYAQQDRKIQVIARALTGTHRYAGPTDASSHSLRLC